MKSVTETKVEPSEVTFLRLMFSTDAAGFDRDHHRMASWRKLESETFYQLEKMN